MKNNNGMMNKTDRPAAYTRSDRIRQMISDNSFLLEVLNRFSIRMGFGDRNVEQVCADNHVDVDTFLAITNFICHQEWTSHAIHIPTMIGYLRKSHHHILSHALPGIKKTLIEGIQQTTTNEIAMIILKFFEGYMQEVRKHMEYEEQVVFRYAESLVDGKMTNKFSIDDFSNRHEHMAGTLDELKELFIYQYNQSANDLISIALMDIISCGSDLMSHCEIENQLLFPAIRKEEEQMRTQVTHAACDDAHPTEESLTDALTEREKEVLIEVAHGLSNKEIADKMNLSFHTITTYRKNISAKLNIHSTAGLVIFAVLHHLINLDGAKMPNR